MGLPDAESGGLAPTGGTTGEVSSVSFAAGSGTPGAASLGSEPAGSDGSDGALGVDTGRVGPDEPLDEITRRVTGSGSATGSDCFFLAGSSD